jgi:ATP-dependent Clp protease, protease subunit
MMSEPGRPPEIPYPFGPGGEPPRRTEPVTVPIVDLPSSDPADRLFDRRTILVTGRLDAAAITRLCAQMMALDGRSADEVELIVNSAGGPLTEIAAVLDVIELMRAAVNVTCTGVAEGTAAALVACARGRRRAGPNARLRLRLDDEQSFSGSATDLTHRAEQLAMCRQQLADALCRATGRPAEVIERELDGGGWHDAVAARDLGLIDEVVDQRPRR